MSCRVAKLIRPYVRQGVSLLALVGFLAATIGMPLPARRIAKNASQAFPCLSRQCGCMNATQCWRGCCCFTNKQKVAWAKANGVELPPFVLAAAKREADRELCRSSCCTKRPAQAPAASNAPLALRLVLAIEARQCHGQAEQWLSLGAVAPLPQPAAWPLAQPCCGDLCLSEDSLSSTDLSPAAPPPRDLVVL